jgi:ribonuclease BN (tRNA processing enzyme)
VRLTVLGTSTPYPRPDNPCSGYLVQTDTTSLWMDAGTGTLAELQRHLPLETLDAIWISHLHADHTADLLTAYYALRFGDVRPRGRVPLIGPPELLERMTAFLGPHSAQVLPEVFAYTEMTGPGALQIGDLALRWSAVRHGMPAFGLRVEEFGADRGGAGTRLAYSGDSGPGDELAELAAGATLLLCEAGESAHPESSTAVHCTPEEAGGVADAAAVGRLLLTHVGDGMSGDDVVRRARSRFAGPTDAARPGQVLEL